MRFILLDRILRMENGKEGSFLKNVTQSEDYFTDHFPESPIMPGALILESFNQASQFLLGYARDFICYPELKQVTKVSFKHYVLPGDQLHVNLKIVEESEAEAVIKATAEVNGRIVCEATLALTLILGDRHPESKAQCQRLKDLYILLSSDPVSRAWESLANRFQRQ